MLVVLSYEATHARTVLLLAVLVIVFEASLVCFGCLGDNGTHVSQVRQIASFGPSILYCLSVRPLPSSEGFVLLASVQTAASSFRRHVRLSSCESIGRQSL